MFSGCLGKIGLNWALTGSITNWGKSKSIFESYSLILASFVYWCVLNSSPIILVKWLVNLNKRKLGKRGAKVGMGNIGGTRLGHKDLLESKLTIIITSHRDLITSKAPSQPPPPVIKIWQQRFIL